MLGKKMIAGIAAISLSFAAVYATEYKYEISPMIGVNYAEGNMELDNHGYFLGGLEFQFNNHSGAISPEISIFGTKGAKYDPTGKTNVIQGAFNGVYTFEKQSGVTPFVKAGIGIENYTNESYGNQDGPFLDAGAGIKMHLSERFALKMEAIYLAKYNNDHAGKFDNNIMGLFGLTYAFGAVEESKAVVVLDDDNDGVANDKDQCPMSAPGVKVDANGCELDSDGDGVVDSKDNCPQTPAGAAVNANGCELDSDGDGVVDSKDKCPNTPKGVKVNANGCELDSDADGVVDSKDKCQNTPAAVRNLVDANGCFKELDLSVNFKTNSNDVDAASMERIRKFADFLKSAPIYNVTIVGYTDSRGSASYNQKLSQKRAQKVRDLLIQEGVNPSVVSAVGKGEENPVASNDTQEGRAKNRRIEAELERIK